LLSCPLVYFVLLLLFVFTDTATTEIYTLSLHDALPISEHRELAREAVRKSLVLLKNNNNILPIPPNSRVLIAGDGANNIAKQARSEEHTSELQSRENLVCRLLLEKKKK